LRSLEDYLKNFSIFHFEKSFSICLQSAQVRPPHTRPWGGAVG
jgi:hypothetical protein